MDGAKIFGQPDAAATPLTYEESLELIPAYIASRDDLNHAERENILRGQAWALRRRHSSLAPLLSEDFIKTLHRRMFNEVWRWAGKYRLSERNLGFPYNEIPVAIRHLLDDTKAWVEHQSFSLDEIAVRLHHRLVLIHPFVNGNGRHARLVADLLLMQSGRERFSWGRENLQSAGELRATYIAALKAADRHDIAPLLSFARS
jgi:Fic-DOC domain mobile mystery protein B